MLIPGADRIMHRYNGPVTYSYIGFQYLNLWVSSTAWADVVFCTLAKSIFHCLIKCYILYFNQEAQFNITASCRVRTCSRRNYVTDFHAWGLRPSSRAERITSSLTHARTVTLLPLSAREYAKGKKETIKDRKENVSLSLSLSLSHPLTPTPFASYSCPSPVRLTCIIITHE